MVNYNKIKTTTFIALWCICFFLTSMYSQTNKGIGFIGASFGDNIISRNGVHIKAKSGVKIYEKDILITRKNGKLQFKLSDDTFVSLGVASKISISKYSYVPNNENSKIILHSEVGVFRVASGKIAKLNNENFIIKTRNSAIVADDDIVRINIESKTNSPDAIACLKGSVYVKNSRDIDNIQSGEFINVGSKSTIGDVLSYNAKNMPGLKDYKIGKEYIKSKKQADIALKEIKGSTLKAEKKFDDNLDLYFVKKPANQLLPKTNPYILPDGFYVFDVSNVGNDVLKLKYKVEKGRITDYDFQALGDIYDKSNFQASQGLSRITAFRGKVVGQMDNGDSILGQFLFNIDLKTLKIDRDSYYSFLVQQTQTYWRVIVFSDNDFAHLEVKDYKLASDVSGVSIVNSDIKVYTTKGDTAPKGLGGLLYLKNANGEVANTFYGGVISNSFPNFNSVEASNY